MTAFKSWDAKILTDVADAFAALDKLESHPQHEVQDDLRRIADAITSTITAAEGHSDNSRGDYT